MKDKKYNINFNQKEIITDLLKHPVAKAVVYGGSALLLLYVGSFAMRVLATTVLSYKALNKAVKS